jgi:TrmH RNA methyltransferase
LRNAAQRRIAYREVDAEELTRMAQSVHHEGICLLVAPRPVPTFSELLRSMQARGLLVALDGVSNPHNVGAILRSAAYFGASGLVYSTREDAGGQAAPASLPAAAKRVAEGGAEYVPVLRLQELATELREAKRAGIVVIGCDARAQTSVSGFRWPQRAVLVLGHEQHGLASDVRAQCDTLLRIDGTKHIDSLNVSVAAGVFMASYTQTHGAPK